MKVLMKNNFTFEYMLYCMSFYHETKGLAESVKSTLVNEMGDQNDDKINDSELTDSLRALFVGRLRDVALSTTPTLSSLSTLKLSHNPIGDAGAIELSHALQYNTALQKLYISSCDVSDSGAIALSDTIAYANDTLKLLDVSNNLITDSGGVRLLSVFKTNITIETIRTSGNLILSELEGLIDSCNCSVSGKSPDQRIKHQIASSSKSLAMLLSPNDITVPSSGNNSDQLEDVLIQVRSLLLSNKPKDALLYVENLLYDYRLCPKGAQKCSTIDSQTESRLESKTDECSSNMDLDEIERSLNIDFSEIKSKMSQSPLVGVSRGRLRPRNKEAKFTQFYDNPETLQQLFVNAYGKLAYKKMHKTSDTEILPDKEIRDRYKIYAEAQEIWIKALWPDRMDVIHEAYPERKFYQTKKKPRPPSNSVNSIDKYVKRLVHGEIQSEPVKTIDVPRKKIQTPATTAADEFEEESSLNATGKSKLNTTITSINSPSAVSITPLGSPAVNSIQLQDDNATDEIIEQEEEDPSSIPIIDLDGIEEVIFHSESEKVTIKLLSSGTLRYFIGNTPRVILREIDFDGIDHLVFPTSQSNTTVQIKIPIRDIIKTLTSLKSLCVAGNVPHNIPQRLQGLQERLQQHEETVELADKRDKRLVEAAEQATVEVTDIVRLESVGESADKDLQVDVDSLNNQIMSIQKTYRLKLVGIPVIFEETFSILKSVLLFGFFEVFCKNHDFQTTTPMIMAMTDNCIYLYHTNANISRCIHITSVSHLLLAQDPLKNLNIAICILPEPGPKYDVMFTAPKDTAVRIVEVLRGIYSFAHSSMLPINKADIDNLYRDVILLKPRKYRIENEFIEPTQRGGS